ncbi:MAG: TIGR02587 family membrane protein [Dongiaceae bacterium]
MGVGRAFAGALLFSLPILMTGEMWEFGLHIDPYRLALLLVLNLGLLTRLSRYGGLRHTSSNFDDLADSLVAFAIAVLASFLVLTAFGVITEEMSFREIVGKVALQSVAGSVGAMLARNQLGGAGAKRDREDAEKTYIGEIFLMLIGALFLSLNVAPTEEVMTITFQTTAWHKLALLIATLVVMHALVYTLEFGGTVQPHPAEGFWSIFARFTVVGYVCVFAISLYMLWSFGYTNDVDIKVALGASVVLAVPGAIGAAVARLIL